MKGISQGVWNDSKIGSNLQSVDKAIGYSNAVGDDSSYGDLAVPNGFEYSRVKNGYYTFKLSTSCLNGVNNNCGIGVRNADRRNDVTLAGVVNVRKNVNALQSIFGRSDYENFPIYAKDINEFITLTREKLVLSDNRVKEEDTILAPLRKEIADAIISDSGSSDNVSDGAITDNTSGSATDGANDVDTEKKNNSLLIYGGIGLGVLVVLVLLLRK